MHTRFWSGNLLEHLEADGMETRCDVLSGEGSCPLAGFAISVVETSRYNLYTSYELMS
jgi:hypothetical protein